MSGRSCTSESEHHNPSSHTLSRLPAFPYAVPSTWKAYLSLNPLNKILLNFSKYNSDATSLRKPALTAVFLTITTDCSCAFHCYGTCPSGGQLSVHEDVSPLAYKPAKVRNLLFHVGVPSTPTGPLLRARIQLHS